MKTKTFTFVTTIFSSCFAVAGAICTPFKVHLQAELPQPPAFIVPSPLPVNWENPLTEKIGRIKTQSGFPEIYASWLKRHPRDKTEAQRYEWLQCLLYYVSMDTNNNGIPDWSAIIQQQPATTLYSQDPDQDGDGLSNVLDPQPLLRGNRRSVGNGVPAHLKFNVQKRPEAAILQEQLYKEYNILAIDHTDEHAAGVLRELLFLLQKGFPKRFVTGLKNLRYIYAFAGHNHSGNIASYHWQAQALSVGGKSNYSDEALTPQIRIDLLSAFSHELGHAVIFEKLHARVLADVSSRFSDWSALNKSQLQASFFSPVFFEPFPLKTGRNIVSQYAMVNRHEWFAESLAASVLNRLGKAGTLHSDWRRALIKNPFNSPQYWVDYTRISDDFVDWFRLLMKN